MRELGLRAKGLLVGAAAFAALLGAAAPALAATDGATGVTQPAESRAYLAGAWAAAITRADGVTEQAEFHFDALGGLYVHPTSTPDGYGSWKSVDGNNFTMTFVQPLYSAAGVYIGTVTVNQNGTVSADSSSFTSAGDATVRDTSGKTLRVVHSTISAAKS
jgi:hypothetical protein